MVEPVQIAQAVVGAGGLVAAAIGIWYLDENEDDFERKLSIKIAAATVVFSAMMFTPLIETQGEFLEFGVVAFPSLKVVADAVTLGFLASALKDLIEKEMEE